jgi:hypothetical protein
MENARWSCEEPTIPDELEAAAGQPASMATGAIVNSRPKKLYPIMPMIHLTARTVDKAGERGVVRHAAAKCELGCGARVLRGGGGGGGGAGGGGAGALRRHRARVSARGGGIQLRTV